MTDDTGAAIGGKSVLGIVVLIIIIGAVVWALSAQKEPADEQAAESVLQAAEKVTAPAVVVPTSQNPVKQVLPKETPLEKTNPFNKTYVNPFE